MLTIQQINEIIALLERGIKGVHTIKPTTRAWDVDENKLKKKFKYLVLMAMDYGQKNPGNGIQSSVTTIKKADKIQLIMLTGELKNLLKHWKSMIKRWNLGNDYNNENMQSAVKLFDKYQDDYYKQLEKKYEACQQLIESTDLKNDDVNTITSEFNKLCGIHERTIKEVAELKSQNTQLLIDKGRMVCVVEILKNPNDDANNKIRTVERLLKSFESNSPLGKPIPQTLSDEKSTAANHPLNIGSTTPPTALPGAAAASFFKPY